MKTKDQVTADFKQDLAALLKKYSRDDWPAEIGLGEKCTSWSSDYWVEVCIPSLYDEDYNTTREYTEINLGKSFFHA